MDYKSWFAKTHKTVLEDTEDGRRTDFVMIIHPINQHYGIEKLQAKTDELMYLLLQSSFNPFLICTKYFIFSQCREHNETHYRSYEGIEIGVHNSEKGKLTELLWSLGFDFLNDKVFCKCEKTTNMPITLNKPHMILKAFRSRNHSHFCLFNNKYSIEDWRNYLSVISTKITKLKRLSKLPIISLETLHIWQENQMLEDTYLEFMIPFQDIKAIYNELAQLSVLVFDKYDTHDFHKQNIFSEMRLKPDA